MCHDSGDRLEVEFVHEHDAHAHQAHGHRRAVSSSVAGNSPLAFRRNLARAVVDHGFVEQVSQRAGPLPTQHAIGCLERCAQQIPDGIAERDLTVHVGRPLVVVGVERPRLSRVPPPFVTSHSGRSSQRLPARKPSPMLFAGQAWPTPVAATMRRARLCATSPSSRPSGHNASVPKVRAQSQGQQGRSRHRNSALSQGCMTATRTATRAATPITSQTAVARPAQASARQPPNSSLTVVARSAPCAVSLRAASITGFANPVR